MFWGLQKCRPYEPTTTVARRYGFFLSPRTRFSSRNQGSRYKTNGFSPYRNASVFSSQNQDSRLRITRFSSSFRHVPYLFSSRTRAHARASSLAMRHLSASSARCRLRLAMCCCTRRLLSSVSRIHCRRSASSWRRSSSSSLWQGSKPKKGVIVRGKGTCPYFVEGVDYGSAHIC